MAFSLILSGRTCPSPSLTVEAEKKTWGDTFVQTSLPDEVTVFRISRVCGSSHNKSVSRALPFTNDSHSCDFISYSHLNRVRDLGEEGRLLALESKPQLEFWHCHFCSVRALGKSLYLYEPSFPHL